MVIFVGVILLLSCLRIQYAGNGSFHHDYMDKDSIQAIKGIFLLLIFASHFSQYVSLTGLLSRPYLVLKKGLGQLVVAPFLFYSGYGVAVSVQKKGLGYIRSMPKRRILKVLFQFDIAVILFWAAQKLLGNDVGIKHFLLSLIAWDSLGNSNWYIFAILALYLISFLVCFGLSAENGQEDRFHMTGWMIFTLSLCLIWLLMRHRPDYCYNTILAYAAGYLFALYKEPIEGLCFQSEHSYWLAIGTLFLIFYVFRKSWEGNLTAYEAASIVFGMIIVLLSAKFKIRNRILHYCGEHLFSLFILQRLPMMLLSNTILKDHIPLFFLCSLAGAFLLSWVFDHTVPQLFDAVFSKCE